MSLSERLEAAEPFFRLAREVINPAGGERPWHADSKDWMVVFSFAGHSLTLGDLRRAAGQEGSADSDGGDGVPVRLLSVQATDKSDRAEGVAALQQAGEPSISTDGPHNIGDHRRWLARQLLDSQLSDREALRIVAYSPALEGYLPQQTALVEKGVEKIIAQHEPAACGASAPSEAPRSAGWQDISSAPRDGTTIQARIPGHGSDNMIAWISDALDDGNGSCGAWTFVLEDQEPPSCWSDGWCWAVNEDGERSAEPTEWKAAPSPADGGEG